MVADNQLLMLVFEHITEDPIRRVIMTAVGLAESNGDEKAHNYDPATRDDSYGLFQINMWGDKGPSRRASFGLQSNDDLYNPETNAIVAGRIYRSQGINAWGSWKDGRYKDYMQRASAANDAVTLGKGKTGTILDSLNPFGDLNPIDDVVDLLAAPVKWAGAAAAWFGNPRNWVRVLEVVGGLILGIVAVSIAVAPRIQPGVIPGLDTARRLRG